MLGASGYTGEEVVRLLALHPVFDVTALTGETQAGKVRWLLLVLTSAKQKFALLQGAHLTTYLVSEGLDRVELKTFPCCSLM